MSGLRSTAETAETLAPHTDTENTEHLFCSSMNTKSKISETEAKVHFTVILL